MMITGAAGFIGGHLCRRIVQGADSDAITVLDLNPTGHTGLRGVAADVSILSSLDLPDTQREPAVLVHLAAEAEVVMPFDTLARLDATNVQGTINAIRAYEPKRVVFTSSSAVYGNAGTNKSRPVPQDISPIGAYGASKIMGEIICREWAAEYGRTAVCLRLGNVIGRGCRGLIPFLVNHAVRNPQGNVPAEMRGGGAIVRDYVPVEVVVDAIVRAMSIEIETGHTEILNIGTGLAMTNGDIGQIVVDRLSAHGLRLELNFDGLIPGCESTAVVLDVDSMESFLGVRRVGRREIVQAIEDAVDGHLEDVRSR